MSAREERRTLKNEADMEQFFRELLPHLKKIEELMAMYEGDRTVDIMIGGCGYVKAGVFNTGYALCKWEGDQEYTVQKEYTLNVTQEAV